MLFTQKVDENSLSPQQWILKWLCVIFFLLYFFYRKLKLPSLPTLGWTNIIKTRRCKIWCPFSLGAFINFLWLYIELESINGQTAEYWLEKRRILSKTILQFLPNAIMLLILHLIIWSSSITETNSRIKILNNCSEFMQLCHCSIFHTMSKTHSQLEAMQLNNNNTKPKIEYKFSRFKLKSKALKYIFVSKIKIQLLLRNEGVWACGVIFRLHNKGELTTLLQYESSL